MHLKNEMDNTYAKALSGKNVPIKSTCHMDKKRRVFESKPIAEDDSTEAAKGHVGRKRRKTSFLDLPREVRDMVYDYYWLNQTMSQCLEHTIWPILTPITLRRVLQDERGAFWIRPNRAP